MFFFPSTTLSPQLIDQGTISIIQDMFAVGQETLLTVTVKVSEIVLRYRQITGIYCVGRTQNFFMLNLVVRKVTTGL